MSFAPANRVGEGKNAQVLIFHAGGQRFGVFIAEVGKLVLEERIAPVPFAHPAMAGLLDSAEQDPVPVFDLYGLLGTRARPPTHVHGARVALFTTERGPVGLRMDTMEGGGSAYEFLSDPADAEIHIRTLPETLRVPVTAVGRDARGPFFFFSPDAFLATLDLGAPGRPDP